MIVGLCILMGGMMHAGGGFNKIMSYISTQHPDMLEPLSRGKMPISLYISQWLLVGICTLSLPQSVVRGISYKDTKALHNAMIIGTVVIGAMTLVATWIGVISKGVLTAPITAYGNSVDNIMPVAHRAKPHPLLGRRHHHRPHCSNHFHRILAAAFLILLYR